MQHFLLLSSLLIPLDVYNNNIDYFFSVLSVIFSILLILPKLPVSPLFSLPLLFRPFLVARRSPLPRIVVSGKPRQHDASFSYISSFGHKVSLNKGSRLIISSSLSSLRIFFFILFFSFVFCCLVVGQDDFVVSKRL